MEHLLVLVPALPLLGFLLLAFGGRRLSHKASACIGAGSVGFAAAIAFLIALRLWLLIP